MFTNKSGMIIAGMIILQVDTISDIYQSWYVNRKKPNVIKNNVKITYCQNR